MKARITMVFTVIFSLLLTACSGYTVEENVYNSVNVSITRLPQNVTPDMIEKAMPKDVFTCNKTSADVEDKPDIVVFTFNDKLTVYPQEGYTCEFDLEKVHEFDLKMQAYSLPQSQIDHDHEHTVSKIRKVTTSYNYKSESSYSYTSTSS